VQSSINTTDFIHPKLGREVTAIGGYYIFGKEIRLPYNGRAVLYFVGYAVLDSTCCGLGGCAYVLVAGYVRQWKYKITTEGQPVSMVTPIEDHCDRKQVRKMIVKNEMVYQVTFRPI
jgi:hypothetical protein